PTPKGRSNYRDLARYILDAKHDGEKVAYTAITNCGFDTPESAIAEVLATQALNTTSRNDKTYHLVVSFRAGERPTPEQLRDIEAHLCQVVGLGEHQRMSAVHTDTDNVHLHIAVNKVHPTSYRCVEPYFDYRKLDAACRELEQRHGLAQDNRIGESARASGRAGDMEAHAGEQSLQGWARRNAAEPLMAAVAREGAIWATVHAAAAECGLELRQRGAGLVLVDGKSGVAVKASSVDRRLSLKALERRLGAFEPAPRSAGGKAQKRYEKKPLHQHPASDALYGEFQSHKQRLAGERRVTIEALRQRQRGYEQQLRQWYAERRDLVKRSRTLTRREKQLKYQDLRKEQAADLARWRDQLHVERKATYTATQPTWQAFLARLVSEGREDALIVLRSREERQRSVARSVLLAPDAPAANAIVMKQLRPVALKNGDVLYSVGDGGVVRDEAVRVRVEGEGTAAAFLALQLAEQKFAGHALQVRGSDAFRHQVAELAALQGLGVQFADPELERRRLEAQRDRQAGYTPALTEYVRRQNSKSGEISGISYRAWRSQDAGSATFRGIERLADGRHVALLQRDAAVLVKPLSPGEARELQRMKPARTVRVDHRGEIRRHDEQGKE
ncbi:TraI/MobA(P) family conjugative relaxase, partial [Xanthomonas phaseoli]